MHAWIIFKRILTYTVLIDPVKFIYSEKATKFCKISTLLLSYVVPVKSKVEISKNFVAFSEYMDFNKPAQEGIGSQNISLWELYKMTLN